MTNLLRPQLIICWVGLAAATAIVAGVFGPWQEERWEGSPAGESTTTTGMTNGVGWLLVGAAVIGAVGLVAFARGWRLAPLVTVIVGLVAVFLARPAGAIPFSSSTVNRWGYGVTLSASVLLTGVGLIALVYTLERFATRRRLES